MCYLIRINQANILFVQLNAKQLAFVGAGRGEGTGQRTMTFFKISFCSFLIITVCHIQQLLFLQQTDCDIIIWVASHIGQVTNIFLCLTHNSGIKEKVKCNLVKGRTLNTCY